MVDTTIWGVEPPWKILISAHCAREVSFSSKDCSSSDVVYVKCLVASFDFFLSHCVSNFLVQCAVADPTFVQGRLRRHG